MAGTNTQIEIQNTTAPTLVSQPPGKLLHRHGSHSSEKFSGSARSNQNPTNLDPDPEKTIVIRVSTPSDKDDSNLTANR